MNMMKSSMNILISHIFSYISRQKLCFVKNGSNFFVDMQVRYKSQSLDFFGFFALILHDIVSYYSLGK